MKQLTILLLAFLFVGCTHPRIAAIKMTPIYSDLGRDWCETCLADFKEIEIERQSEMGTIYSKDEMEAYNSLLSFLQIKTNFEGGEVVLNNLRCKPPVAKGASDNFLQNETRAAIKIYRVAREIRLEEAAKNAQK